MKKEFIPLHLALKLKALGFDYPCFATWNGDVLDMSLQVPSDDYFTKAPTFSQAFRFFREKYGLEHHIWSGKIRTIFYGYNILNIDKQEFVVNNSEIGGGDCDYETYEEAELHCLNKLITSI